MVRMVHNMHNMDTVHDACVLVHAYDPYDEKNRIRIFFLVLSHSQNLG